MKNPYSFSMLDDQNSNDIKFRDISDRCLYHDDNLTLESISGISIIHINARSIKNKFDELQNLIQRSGVDWSAICISETWLKKDVENLFELDNYLLYASSRENSQGGGTAIYVNKRIESKRRNGLEGVLAESTFVEISLKKNKIANTMIIGQVYKPPNLNNTVFLDQLEYFFSVNETGKNLYILAGDFNFNFWQLPNDKNALALFNLMTSFNFIPTISKPTRMCNDQEPSLLDNFFINDISYVSSSGIIVDDISDHFPIFMSLDKIVAFEKKFY